MRISANRLAAGLVAAAALAVAGAPAASAQPLPFPVPPEVRQVVDQAQVGSTQAQDALAQVDGDARNAAVGSLESAGIAPPPGLAPPPPPPPPAPPAPPDNTPVSPCPRIAAACVDLAGDRTWLQADGKLSYGPVRMSHGKPGWETPTGTYQVTRKVRHEVSREFNNAPMPYSVYFVGGIAFHQGDPAYQSHGCIRMDEPAAAAYFDRLQVGDTVFVF